MDDGFYNSAGVDSSQLYDPDVMGDGYIATFLTRSDGTPLRYALSKYGTPGPILGFSDSSGNDVGPEWAAKGTAKYLLATPTFNNGLVDVTFHTPGSGTASFTIKADGTAVSSPAGDAGGVWYGNGNSFPGVGAGYEILITPSGGGGNTLTNPAASWISLGSDVTVSYSGHSVGSVALTIQIRPVGGSPASTATVTLALTSDG